MSRRSITVLGDVLLDRDLDGRADRLCPDAPVPVVDRPVERARPGGAGLAAALAAGDGYDVTLVTALAGDGPGARLAELLAEAGVRTVDVGRGGTTAVKTRVRAAGTPLVRFDEGGDVPELVLSVDAHDAIAAGDAVLVADYGRGLAADPALRRSLEDVARRRPVVWDPHPLGPAPVPGARVATPNHGEAAHFAPEVGGDGLAAVTRRAAALARRWRVAGVAVTMGAAGALYLEGDGPPLATPAAPASGDPCGAGDRFASALAGALAAGALPSEAVGTAVRAASAFVADGGAASVRVGAPAGHPANDGHGRGSPRTAVDLARSVRAAGGTVVATGGCFDLLHAGHVSLLQAARRLGDALVVCLNSDSSVRRLKGSGRPIVPAEDRAAVLLSLSCVDAVHVFGEDTPVAALTRLRPHVWAKGADYTGASLPEADALAAWGGQAVVLPFLDGRSTSRLVEEVARAR